MFVTTPGSPFVNGLGTIDASWLNYVRASLPQCGDFGGGGTYTPSAPVIVNGSGMVLDPVSFAVRNLGTAEFYTGSTSEWRSGSSFVIYNGVLTLIAADVSYSSTSGGGATMTLGDGTGASTGFIVVKYACSVTLDSNSSGGGQLIVKGTDASHYAFIEWENHSKTV